MDTSERIDKLEKELSELRSCISEKPKKERKPREASAYNTFVKEYLAEQKIKLGTSYNHKEAFKSAATAWAKKKEQK